MLWSLDFAVGQPCAERQPGKTLCASREGGLGVRLEAESEGWGDAQMDGAWVGELSRGVPELRNKPTKQPKHCPTAIGKNDKAGSGGSRLNPGYSGGSWFEDTRCERDHRKQPQESSSRCTPQKK
jgi:hypothetical protein